ncbi:hypothetical protein [Chryseobacterium shandongense]|uniref:DUF3352 domain-containing protein n=1 Tax=Chryseobacterium shandongense TaxID=1493872 RepID=A0ABN5S048_9FLAO|nr:hypothetical protein [Chryseobacterium shandongense]AZA96241.1 hypothetical protein EG353_11985 [Chryseobacterium shandongense]
MKKKIVAFILLILLVCGYFVLYHSDKELKYVPGNADVVVLVDTKKATRQYLSDFLTHPSQWLKNGKTSQNTISIHKSGLKMPDFLQIFHIENTGFSEWYCVLELENKSKFVTFLKQEKFAAKSNNVFGKDHFFIKIEGEYCIVGTSDSAFKNIKSLLADFSQKAKFSSDRFIDGSLGSISIISRGKVQNFPIHLNSDNIEITNGNKEDFSSLISKLEKRGYFIEAELDKDNIKRVTSIFNKSISDSTQINSLQATATLQQVNDTIVTYVYDDDFNEIEKKTIQKITEPNYTISIKTSAPEKVLQYFQDKKWINTQNHFTAIPFQPNILEEKADGIEIYSTRKTIKPSFRLNGNYIFIKNNALLLSSLKSLNSKEKSVFSNLNYIFYGNKNQDYFVRLQFKKENLPLILRWQND